MFFHNLGFILPSFQQFLLKRMLVLSHKMILIKNEAALLCITMQERAMGICSYNLVYNFTIQLIAYSYIAFAIKKFSFCGALFNGILAWKRAISKRQFIEIVPLLVVFHLPYSKYEGVKICFYSCRYQNQTFSLLSHTCSSCSTRVVLVSLVSQSCRQCRTRVTFLWLVPGTSVANQTRS